MVGTCRHLEVPLSRIHLPSRCAGSDPAITCRHPGWKMHSKILSRKCSHDSYGKRSSAGNVTLNIVVKSAPCPQLVVWQSSWYEYSAHNQYAIAPPNDRCQPRSSSLVIPSSWTRTPSDSPTGEGRQSASHEDRYRVKSR